MFHVINLYNNYDARFLNSSTYFWPNDLIAVDDICFQHHCEEPWTVLLIPAFLVYLVTCSFKNTFQFTFQI